MPGVTATLSVVFDSAAVNLDGFRRGYVAEVGIDPGRARCAQSSGLARVSV